MPDIDWYYHRTNCATCEKSRAYLGKHHLQTPNVTEARKHRLGPAEALKLARAAATVVAARGKSITTFNLKKDKPTDQALLAVLLGPTGNLRAPAIKVGNTLLIGFNPDAYADYVAR